MGVQAGRCAFFRAAVVGTDVSQHRAEMHSHVRFEKRAASGLREPMIIIIIVTMIMSSSFAVAILAQAHQGTHRLAQAFLPLPPQTLQREKLGG